MEGATVLSDSTCDVYIHFSAKPPTHTGEPSVTIGSGRLSKVGFLCECTWKWGGYFLCYRENISPQRTAELSSSFSAATLFHIHLEPDFRRERGINPCSWLALRAWPAYCLHHPSPCALWCTIP